MRRGGPWAAVARAIPCALVLEAALAAPAVPQVITILYADRSGPDVVMDAPWKTVRDYVPVLFFFPQLENDRRVERISVSEWVDGAAALPPVVVDRRTGPDTLNGATFLGAMGEVRSGLTEADSVHRFWHYVVRVPHAALRAHGAPDVHHLLAEVRWSEPGLTGRRSRAVSRVLRVLVDPSPLATLDPADRSLDVHLHTIAEQSASGVLDVNGSHKAFGGPVVMLLESAYALGLVPTPPDGGNWSAFRDGVVVTDHNVFYSARPYDAGTAPGAGPTAASDGRAGEAAWYRANLGDLAGEEITLKRGSNQDDRLAPNLGHHFLAYGTRHFEGPWHGGLFLTSRLENPNTLLAVLAGMKAAGPAGFAYAAHPDLDGFVWPPEYFDQAIGFSPHDSRQGPAVDSAGREFLFKGSEVWNTKYDEVARGNGRLAASSAFRAMNPFAGGPAAQRFHAAAWDAELRRSLDRYLGQVARGLSYSFREAPAERFVRKLYVSAGSDAHGDFDYADEVTATAVPWSGWLHANAFARVRTVALVHERPAGDRSPVDALREGNTVITDGPVFEVALDADGRHDPGAGAARWHDAEVRWENADGTIGGAGAFDGGRTALVPQNGAGARVRSTWRRSATPGAGAIARVHFDRVTASARDSFDLAAGSEGVADDRPLPVDLDGLAALLASVRDPLRDERCIANPVWVAPVRAEIAARAPEAGAPAGVALAPGALRVAFRFPFSMSAAAGTRAFVRPLDADGNSTDPAIELVPDPGWREEDGIAGARYSVVNAAAIPQPAGEWDAVSHARRAGVRSFVVYLEGPADVHGNRLNDVGWTFTIPPQEVPR